MDTSDTELFCVLEENYTNFRDWKSCMSTISSSSIKCIYAAVFCSLHVTL
jgi:hypothetical protein